MRLQLTILFLFLTAGTSLGQQYQWRNYALSKGLPQSEIWFRAFAQDKRGTIWCGTNGGGIGKLEGEKFSVLTTRDGLCGNQVWHIQYDEAKDHLWFVTFNKGISLYDGKKFTNYFDDQGYFKDGLAGIITIHEDEWGRHWLVTNT
ncbi:MAG: two-component regulator propeller domain-containing protein, partial [Bacteroidota bacterium]